MLICKQKHTFDEYTKIAYLVKWIYPPVNYVGGPTLCLTVVHAELPPGYALHGHRDSALFMYLCVTCIQHRGLYLALYTISACELNGRGGVNFTCQRCHFPGGKNVSFAFASETQSEYGRIYTYSVGRFISNHLPS